MGTLTDQVTPFRQLMGVTHGECVLTYGILMHCFQLLHFFYAPSVGSFCSKGGDVSCTEIACLPKCKCQLTLNGLYMKIVNAHLFTMNGITMNGRNEH